MPNEREPDNFSTSDIDTGQFRHYLNRMLITIDTDNAIIRFRVGQARADGVPELALRQLMTDIETIAVAVSRETGVHFRTEWIAGPAEYTAERQVVAQWAVRS